MWRGTKCMSFKFGTIKYCSLCSSGQTWQAIFSSNGNNSMVRHSNSAGDLFAEKRPDLPLGHHKAAAVGANPAIFGFLAGPRVYSFVRTLLSVVSLQETCGLTNRVEFQIPIVQPKTSCNGASHLNPCHRLQ